MSTPIFKWSGEYSGFISGGRIFGAHSEYLGWVDQDGAVWHRTGQYVGELVDDGYILRNTIRVTPVSRVAMVAPVSPVSPVAHVNRVGRVGRAGWVDAFDDLLA
jgi:hypothetical protein